MACTLTLFLLAGVSAEVPDWVKQKSALNVPSINSIMAPARSLQSKLAKQTPNSRRLQAIMSKECKDACPGVEAFIEMMMKAMSEEPKEDENKEDENPLASTLMLCDHRAAIICSGKEKACKDEGAEEAEEDPDGEASFECLCACPDFFMANTTAKMCKSKDTFVSCLTGESQCKKIVKDMGGKTAADLSCARFDAECDKKGEKMGECMGEDQMKTWGNDCEKKDGGVNDTVTCCPLLKEMVGCYTQKCVDLDAAYLKHMVDTSTDAETKKAYTEEMENSMKTGKDCPDSGVAASEADYAAKLSAATGGSVTADDAPAQAVPVLGLLAAIAAYSA